MQLSTARLRLRELQPSDAPFVLALVNEPAFIEFIGDRGMSTVADAERYIAEGPWRRPGAPGGGLNVVERLDSGEPLGICGLLKRDFLDHPDLGYAFLARQHGQGYAHEAATAVLRHARQDLELKTLHAITAFRNPASVRILRRL